MILLDTNIISELWREKPDRKIIQWMDNEAAENLYLSVITIAEIQYGIANLPSGKKQTRLREALEQNLIPAFRHSILTIDLSATEFYG